MAQAQDVAEYFLTSVDEEAGDSLSSLKLQKLLYYAQGYNLAIHGAPLFNEAIEAWEHGPVVPLLYRQYKQHGSEPIPPPKAIDVAKFDNQTRELLDEVFEVYGQFSAAKLRNMTHAEKPWLDAYRNGPSTTISLESMKEYFKTQIVNVED